MAAIFWTRQSQEDIEAIRSFISRNSPRVADLFIDKLVSSVDQLKRFPFSGGIVPELNRGDIREIIRGQYRIVYRASETSVTVLTVYHGARLLDEGLLQ